MRPLPAAVLATVLALGFAGCGRADERTGDTGATTLTVYASLPLQGAGGAESRALANGARLALREAGGRAGELVVKLVVLDDATPKAGRWDPEQTGENARTVVRDRTAIAYLGDGPSGATAISLPVLNAAGVPQVSPTSGYGGLTSSLDAIKGEPEKYYPSAVRTFARPVPADGVQVRALAATLSDQRCGRLHLLEERDPASRGLADGVERLAPGAGVEVVGRDALRPDQRGADVAAAVVARRPDCVLHTGALSDASAALFDALHAADPKLELVGASGLALPEFAAALSPGTQARTQLTAPPGVLEPLPGVRAFVRRYRDALGLPARSGAIYGFEAMSLILGAIERAGPLGADRTAVARALLAPTEHAGPLGSYRIDAGGDTSRMEFSRLEVRGGRLVRRETRSYAAE